MARLVEFTCPKCGEKAWEVAGGDYHPLMCSKCNRAAANASKEEHLAKLAELTIEERIARIEEILYDMPGKIRLIGDVRYGGAR